MMADGNGIDCEPMAAQTQNETIQELLTLCAENEVQVPYHLRQTMSEDAGNDGRGQHVFISGLHRRTMERQEEHKLVAEYRDHMEILGGQLPIFDLRIHNGSYKVMVPDRANDPLKKKKQDGEVQNGDTDGQATTNGGGVTQHIATIHNSNVLYSMCAAMLRCFHGKGNPTIPNKEKTIMEGVNLVFEPSRMYLVLGAPGSGKSTLLKMIAQKLKNQEGATVGGKVSINGVTNEKDLWWNNVVGYIDQIDRLHPWLTVYETLNFAWECRSGGTHRELWYETTEDANKLIEQLDAERTCVNKVMEGLGLSHVKDTFVGDQTTVRGVSGGEKKRVTVAEMLCAGYPVMCCDEISTGLDAATTYDITKLMSQATRVQNSTLVVSLLQPPPETVANFDDLILLSEGKVIYSGPVDEVLEHFESLGYVLPERMDLADWLQTLPTPDGAAFLRDAQDAGVSNSELRKKHLTTDEFVQKFYESQKGKEIMAKLESPYNEKDAEFVRSISAERYANSQKKSLGLVMRRELLLWWRDQYQIKQKVGQNLILAVVVGTIFWDADPDSIIGVLFQSMFINVLGAMLLIVKQFPARAIFYKQQDANFFPTWCFVAGRSVANIPNAMIDSFLYGGIVYWFVGLAFGNGASIAPFFMWLLLLFITSTTTGLMFGVFPAVMEVITLAQAGMAVIVVLMVLFSGFTVQPDVIPGYWMWAYWMNPLAWTFRGLAVNEFQSGAYDEPSAADPTMTEGEAVLTRYGFTHNDEPFTYPWAGYGVAVLLGMALVFLIAATVAFTYVRFATGKVLLTEDEGDEDGAAVIGDVEEAGDVGVSPIPFNRVDLTFRDIHYTVKSSISDEKLELLKGIDGVVRAGKMTALMGSSGAGKTTLMDVLALRKTSGDIEGEVWLNGHPQEEESFRRSTGYVVQFDEQSEQLTIRETVEFSALLRLDEKDEAVDEESRKKFVDMTLAMLELTRIQNLQVGTDETGGLSFEQRKRLSIAVELVSNPSILFLDEPTSGLDARAALIVMRGLRRIAESGRAVCATIHQPSISVFSEFDSLLLLKRGGEAVYYGELGENSNNLITYLERYNATPKIKPGENPATWMLTTIGAGSANVGGSGKAFDYAGSYHNSKLRQQCLELIDEINSGAQDDNEVTFEAKYATSFGTQSMAVLKRAMTIYRRSPSYNITRNIVSVLVAVLFGSVFIQNRSPTTESDINSIFNAIFVSVVFVCVSAQNTVLGFFEKERNMFYRHKASNMYDSRALLQAFSLSELPFLLLSSAMFVVPFYFIMGFENDAEKFFLFYTFVFMGFSAFTYAGQMFMALVRDSETAQAVGGMWVTFSILFSGLLIKPDAIPDFWTFAYWVFPGHYLFEALFTTQFSDDDTTITASVGSTFYDYLGCTSSDQTCEGTVSQYLAATYSDFARGNVYYCGIYLAALIVGSRLVTWVALKKLNYRST